MQYIKVKLEVTICVQLPTDINYDYEGHLVEAVYNDPYLVDVMKNESVVSVYEICREAV